MEGQRILIVKPSSFGDIVHSLPFLHVLRGGLPNARITWVVARPCADLLDGHPEIDELAIFERARWGGARNLARLAREFPPFIRRLRRERFDLAVDLQGLFRSGLVTYLSGAPTRVGFARSRELSRHFYNVRVDVGNGEMHAVQQNLLVAKKLGLAIEGPPVFNVHVPDEAKSFAEGFWAAENPQGSPVVALLPSSRWRSKRWPADMFAELADRIARKLGAVALFLGGPGDEPLVDGLRAKMHERSLTLVGKTTIKQSAAVLERAAAVVANDSGPMHLAVALGRPVVALYGPTAPEITGPYGGHVKLLRSAHECAPCFKPDCDDPKCMRDITVAMVFDAVEGLLKT